MNRDLGYLTALAVTFAATAALVAAVFAPFLGGGGDPTPPALAGRPAAAPFAPPSPLDAPPGLAGAVQAGARLVTDTQARLGERVRAHLACGSCHFEGGLTAGGRNGGVSLVGAAAAYPRPGPDGPITLAQAANDCLVRNLGGTPLPAESPELRDLLAYLTWISKDLPVYGPRPPAPAAPEPLAAGSAPGPGGEAAYRGRCAVCHGADGAGTDLAPPLWGPASFGRGSQFADAARLAGFVARNMPRQNPFLSPDEARAVAAWVADRPRPDWPAR